MPKAYRPSPFTAEFNPPRSGGVAETGLDYQYGALAGRLEQFSRQRSAEVGAARVFEAERQAEQVDPSSLDSMRSEMSASGRAYNQKLLNRYLDDGFKSIANQAESLSVEHRANPEAFLEAFREYGEGVVGSSDPMAREAFGRYAFHTGQRYVNALTEQAQRVADEENKAAVLGQLEQSMTDLSNSAFAVGKGAASIESISDLSAKADYWVRQGFEDAEIPLLSAEQATSYRERIKQTVSSSLLLGEYSTVKGIGAQEAFITRFNDGNHELSSEFSVEERRALSRTMMTEVREAKAEARMAEAARRAELAYRDHAYGQQLQFFEARVDSGIAPSRDEYELFRKKLLESGDTDRLHELDGAYRFAQESRGFALMSVDEMRDFIDKKVPELETTGDVSRVDRLRSIYRSQVTAREADPMGTAQGLGLVPAEPVDLADPESVARRVAAAQKVEATWGMAVSPLSKAEADGLALELSRSDADTQAMKLEGISRGTPADSSMRAKLVDQLDTAGQAIPAAALATIDQLTTGPGPQTDPGLVARKVLSGPHYASQLPATAKKRDEVIATARGIIGNSLELAGTGGESAMNAVYNVYLADTYAVGDADVVDPVRVERAVEQVFGSKPGKLTVGSVPSYVIPPRGWTVDDIEAGFSGLTPSDFRSQGGIAVAPGGLDEAQVWTRAKDSARLVQMGAGEWGIEVDGADGDRYMLANPDGEALRVTAGMLNKSSFRAGGSPKKYPWGRDVGAPLR